MHGINTPCRALYLRGSELSVIDADTFDWDLVQFGFFSAGGSISAKFAPKAAEAGCIVIDNTSQYRYDADIPLVVPEVNKSALANYRERNIIANPNCSTIQMVVALKPIHDAVGIDRVNIATYQSVSGAGKTSMEALARQTADLLNAKPLTDKEFSRQMAFNVIPQIDVFMDNGYTKEEMKMVWETRKIMGDESILVNPTAARVPVFYGHAEAIHIETRSVIEAEDIVQLLKGAPGIKVYEDPAQFPTQVCTASGIDWVHVGRIRKDISLPNGINLWVVSDNIRKGAASNSVQIAETLIAEFL